MWYTDPLEAHTNTDGVGDFQELNVADSLHATWRYAWYLGEEPDRQTYTVSLPTLGITRTASDSTDLSHSSLRRLDAGAGRTSWQLVLHRHRV